MHTKKRTPLTLVMLIISDRYKEKIFWKHSSIVWTITSSSSFGFITLFWPKPPVALNSLDPSQLFLISQSLVVYHLFVIFFFFFGLHLGFFSFVCYSTIAPSSFAVSLYFLCPNNLSHHHFTHWLHSIRILCWHRSFVLLQIPFLGHLWFYP